MAEREAALGIEPDPEVEAYMTAAAFGRENNVNVELVVSSGASSRGGAACACCQCVGGKPLLTGRQLPCHAMGRLGSPSGV